MSLLDVLTDGRDRAQATQRIAGVVVGLVTDNADPDGLGRVKVRFPWLNEGAESFWAKIATLYAGGQRGSVVLPEVDDEVLVAFEHGNVNYPYVLGALYNTQAQPPATNADGKNNLKVFRSRSGHELIFDDDDAGGAEKVRLRSNAGHVVELDDTSGVEKLSITSSAGHVLELDDRPGGEKVRLADKSGSNTITIDTLGNAIAIKAAVKISLEAQQVEITATRLTMQANGTGSLAANGPLTIRGAVVSIN